MSNAHHASAPCMWMRGGTSKGAYFLASDLPANPKERDAFLLGIMGSPDLKQIDGIGGADPLTSKVAIVKPSKQDGVDVDYLFLQVSVDKALVSSTQNCGNILAGVAPFAIERGLIAATPDVTTVSILMENTGQLVKAQIPTPEGNVSYSGNSVISGVPGTANPIALTFTDTVGATCGSLFPTGNLIDVINDIEVTCIDGGMPTVILKATDLGIKGTETREDLDGNTTLKAKLEAIRLKAGHIMNLGDVTDKTIPKMTMISPAQNEGALSTRTFIPHRCHASIGVLGAVSVAFSCLTKNTVAAQMATLPEGTTKTLEIEHPIGQNTIQVNISDSSEIEDVAVVRTARKLFDGTVFAPENTPVNNKEHTQ